MKFIVALFFLGVAMCAPQFRGEQQQFRAVEQPARRFEVNPNNFLRTVRYDVSPIEGANFRYIYGTENNINVEKEGRTGHAGQSNMFGSYSFETPEGEVVHVSYVADEGGYRAESDHIPVAPPMPAHALEQIRIAAEQRAAGIRWDHQGFQI